MRTAHYFDKPWEYTQFGFAPTVLLAERRIPWYDEETLINIRNILNRLQIMFFWNETSDKTGKYTKHSTSIEIYMKFPREIEFSEKIEKMRSLIGKIKPLEKA